MSLRATLLLAVGVFGTGVLAGCAPDAPGETPESTLRAFVSAMERSVLDDRARADAFALLDEGSQERLASRARRATHLARRPLEPWEMIAPGSFRLRVPLDPMEIRVDGERATIRLQADERTAEVPMVREQTPDGPRWRLVLVPDDTPEIAP
ncbi:MAG: hypothetical protein H6724_04590 [Sandaracinus sp.]|nr:hypothetical protein [Sandaracinus sp.]